MFQKMVLLVMALACVLSSAPSGAAPMKSDLKKILEISALPARLEKIKSSGPGFDEELRKLAFNSENTLKVRWKSLMALSSLKGMDSVKDLDRALKSPDWFMRDAALQAYARVAPTAAAQKSREALNDPALVVRTTAVGNLKKMGDPRTREILWEKLYSNENFRGTQSLWIRRHIVEALAEKPTKTEAEKFVKILSDRDRTLHMGAIMGLERLTGLAQGARDENLSTRRMRWQNWWAGRKSTQSL